MRNGSESPSLSLSLIPHVYITYMYFSISSLIRAYSYHSCAHIFVCEDVKCIRLSTRASLECVAVANGLTGVGWMVQWLIVSPMITLQTLRVYYIIYAHRCAYVAGLRVVHATHRTHPCVFAGYSRKCTRSTCL